MASIKGLKKDINGTVIEIIEDTYLYKLANRGKADKDADGIIDDAVALRDELIARIYADDDKKGKELRAHFNQIQEDLQAKSLELIGRIDKLPEA